MTVEVSDGDLWNAEKLRALERSDPLGVRVDEVAAGVRRLCGFDKDGGRGMAGVGFLGGSVPSTLTVVPKGTDDPTTAWLLGVVGAGEASFVAANLAAEDKGKSWGYYFLKEGSRAETGSSGIDRSKPHLSNAVVNTEALSAVTPATDHIGVVIWIANIGSAQKTALSDLVKRLAKKQGVIVYWTKLSSVSFDDFIKRSAGAFSSSDLVVCGLIKKDNEYTCSYNQV